MIYPERMTAYDAAILIYSQCYHNGDTPLKKSNEIASYPVECSFLLDAICEAIKNKTLASRELSELLDGSPDSFQFLFFGTRDDYRNVTISKTDLKAWLEDFHPELKPAFLFGAEGTQIPIISREPEKPLKTIKAIAEYCEVHESTVKTWRKQYKDFPASTPGSGTVAALPSELNGWIVRRGKK